MTGHQPAPTSGRTVMGVDTKTVGIQEIVKSIGIDKIITIDPYDIKTTIEAIRETLTYDGPCVIIAQRACPLITERSTPYETTEKCGSCGVCTTHFGCPAIIQTDNKAEIDQTLCNGCGVCALICPHKAIRRITKP
jgi:indolepyruvate ferredoxin oxidoreductase alpha subunit